MKDFRVGIFARIDKQYRRNEETGEYGYVEEIVYKVHDWCNDSRVEYYKKDGEVCVYLHDFQFDRA